MAFLYDFGALQNAANRLADVNDPKNVLGIYQTMAQLENARLQQQNIFAELQMRNLELQMKQAEAQRVAAFMQAVHDRHAAGKTTEDTAGNLDPEYVSELYAANPALADQFIKSHAETQKAKIEAERAPFMVAGDDIVDIRLLPGGKNATSGTSPVVAPATPDNLQKYGLSGAAGPAGAPPTPSPTPAPTPTAGPEATPLPQIPGTTLSQGILPPGGGVLAPTAATAPPSAPTAPTPTPLSVTPQGVTPAPIQTPSAFMLQQQQPLPPGVVYRRFNPEKQGAELKLQQQLLDQGALPQSQNEALERADSIANPNDPKMVPLNDQLKRQILAGAQTSREWGKVLDDGTRLAGDILKQKATDISRFPPTREDALAQLRGIAPPDDKYFGDTYKRYAAQLQSGSFTPAEGGRILDQAQKEAAQLAVARGTVGPKTEVTLAGQVNPRLDRSYALNQRELDNMAKPIDETVSRMSRLQETIAQGSPTADALISPELLSVMSGGLGSGLRMNEAEISRIVGGRSVWEDLKARIQRWSTNPETANSITADQRKQIHALVDAVNQKLVAKQNAIRSANDALVQSDSIPQHREIVNKARQALADIDQAPPVGKPQAGGVIVRLPNGKLKSFPNQQSADAFKKAAGLP